MAEKNIQMQRKTATGYDKYYPKTKAGLVEFADGTTVEAHKAEDATNAHKPENVGVIIATQQEAEAGTDNTKFMTPLRVTQVTDYSPGDVCIFPLGEPQTSSSGGYGTTWKLAPNASLKIGKGGTLRIRFWLMCRDDTGTIYGRIYRNGSPVGTERSTKSKDKVVFTEDIGGWSPGDTVELWVKLSSGSSVRSPSGSYIGIYVNKSDFVRESDDY